MNDQLELTPELMLGAYSVGLFPMGSSENPDTIDWYDPDPRGVMPLYGFHLPKRLCRTALSDRFTVTSDRDFEGVMRACAAPAPGRETTWISETIVSLFCRLHDMGYGHSIETWHDGRIVGGLYGVALGSAFFGESMFSRETDASKVALVHLVARLRLLGFDLLDTQFGTTHLSQFGGVEIDADDYRARLRRAVRSEQRWTPLSTTEIATEIRQIREETRLAGG
ncbi:leucyl/phenylalanyl-tRNA--protein transferase [Acetobacter sp.]|uniref:leucyl/phenylalanyl-tRNA--protein transferase n=1 Tax=Acetobacter sp. TaxID=440 RepID=UPI0025C45140|nr:leucyl/phenylalanyl-tRNA--protein transferase [Acetobacter sp.]MCH4091333.1 leucyl/phenylalanyl-tRNA--protein transferase [Acetobacter sp.]MCI1299311.1 leucyl/phenylalanyl-tRNA--protein transferase [Acetobacter sp.]MCI1316685.1 leucyl/phenylalanyl-tRNA--protein transferase [Acetobacter sp.]